MTKNEKGIVTPTVSIGMPVYNGAEYIRKAIDSLLSQTFNDFELIISDNASSDSTEYICQEYVKNDSRIRYFRQPENMGGEWNFRFVFEEAKGTYFMWAAADDMWAPDWIKRLLDNFSEGVCISFGKIVVIGVDDQILTQYHPMQLNSNKLVRLAQFFLWNSAWKANLFYGLYKRSILTENKTEFFSVWNNRWVGADDNRPIFLALQFGRLENDSTACYFKRDHPDSAAYQVSSSSFYMKLLHTAFPYKTILLHCWFLCIPSKWDVKIMLLATLPIDIIRVMATTYKNAFSHLLRKNRLLRRKSRY
ncbi:glycosyltransferase family 2 protein [Sulfuriflexus mobilis]|uniref:glycosyltransferase family 2 protein n=1 Tax=Sulfuriflexus mobilis TaxID=1811807 RepID=UPI000F8196CC|nr:glycosyltransferase family 2 protein [Sulfuriflexus mobilis]